MLSIGNGVVSPAGWTALGMGGGPAGSRPDSSSTSWRHRLALCLRGREALKETARPPPPPLVRLSGVGPGEGLTGVAGGSEILDGRCVLMVVESDKEDNPNLGPQLR
jgi:hypothetical protein